MSRVPSTKVAQLSARPGPSSGVHVVEFSAWVTAPPATALLSDRGAEVIKIEHPEHADPIRGNVLGDLDGTPSVDISVVHELANRGNPVRGSQRHDRLGPAGPRAFGSAGRCIRNKLAPEARAVLRSMSRIFAGRTPGSPMRQRRGREPKVRKPICPPSTTPPSGLARALGHAASQVTGRFIQNPGPGLGDISGGIVAGRRYRCRALRQGPDGRGSHRRKLSPRYGRVGLRTCRDGE